MCVDTLFPAIDSREFWMACAESVPDILLLVDPAGIIRYVNRAPAGMERATLLGSSVFDHVPPESRATLTLGIADIFDGAPARMREQRTVRPDGTERWYATHTAPVTADGRIAAAIVVARDITESKHAAEHLRDWQKMDALGHLAAGIAHDFRNVLTIVSASAELIRDASDGASTMHLDAEMILMEAKRGVALTSQLLAFSRRQRPPANIVDMNDVVGEIADTVRRVAGTGVKIMVRLDPVGAWVTVNRSQLEQIVMNLLLNSRDAITGPGTITLATERIGERVRLLVTDDGCGMSEETRRHMLDPFFTTKGERGTGLGLSMVYAIVRQAGGVLDVKSAPGDGTTVSVMLPATSWRHVP